MAHLATRHLAVLILVAGALAAAPRANADPSSLLADPGDFSGSETLISFDVFEDQEPIDGDEMPSVSGVEFMLSSGAAAKFMNDYYYLREFDPQDPGSLNNFLDYSWPYADLQMRFPGVVHRLAFELRATDQHEIALSLLSSGSIVDEVMIPGRGSDHYYFYGLENPAGFDEVLLHVQDDFGGPFILDNLTFESLADPPEEGPPLLSCVGFSSPLEPILQDPRKAHFAKLVALWLGRTPVKLLRARLLDEEEDLEVGGEDLIAPPLARVLFTPEGGEETLDVTADVTWKDWFTFSRKGYWRLGLKRYEMQTPGTYLVTMESGDESEYQIDPTCSESIIRKAPKRHHFWRR